MSLNDNKNDISAPICDFAEKYGRGGAARLHIPGHKGKNFTGCEANDLTEIFGADNLYRADGIIRQSEENASSLFDSGVTVYSTEGCSQCICAMLYLAYLKSGRQRPVIIAARNVHSSFLRAAALLDFDIEWIYPADKEYSLCKCTVTTDALKDAVRRAKNAVALYITSPDYLGNTADVSALSEVCHENGLILLVDNAHGAYLKFLPESRHPLDSGADMCADSAHKTLTALTGGAYLHISKKADDFFKDNAKRAMEMFGSTSPSYLILQSLDKLNKYVACGYREKLAAFSQKILTLKHALSENGLNVIYSDDILKLTVNTRQMGYTGAEAAEILRERGVETEYADPDYLVMMLTPENSDEELKLLQSVLLSIKHRRIALPPVPLFHIPKRAMSIRQAVLSAGRKVSLNQAENKIMASLCVSCPPAVTCTVAGEVISKEDISILRYYGIENLIVL